MLFLIFFTLKGAFGKISYWKQQRRRALWNGVDKMCKDQSLSTILLYCLSVRSLAIYPCFENGFENWNNAKYGHAVFNK